MLHSIHSANARTAQGAWLRSAIDCLACSPVVATAALVVAISLLCCTSRPAEAQDVDVAAGHNYGLQPTVTQMGQLQSQTKAQTQLFRPKFFNAYGATRNPVRASLEEMKAVQLEQLQKFRGLAAAGRWVEIHRDHFDWYMWPIEDGSQDRFNVLEDDVHELLADEQWLERYLESLELVCAAWGWDVAQAKPIDPLASGMGWTDWDIRLAKMIRSLWLFGQVNETQSLQAFARLVKPHGGLRYGHINLDEVFYMN